MLDYPTLPGDIDHLIADDHAVVERQFQHLEARRGDRRALVDQIVFELSLHADAEERVLYPALKQEEMQDAEQESLDDHHVVKELLVTLSGSEPDTEEFENALIALMATIRHHVQEEETRVLPAFRTAVGAKRMAELGPEFLAAKRMAPTHAHPSAPSSRIGHKLADAGAKVVDMMRDKASGRQKNLATDPSGTLDPQAQRLLDAFSALNPQPPEILDPAQARRQPSLVNAVNAVLMHEARSQDPEPVAAVHDLPVPTGDGVTSDGRTAAHAGITARVYHPKDAGDGPLPIVLWIHGGGWVLYDVDTYDASCRGVANKTGAIVISPEYRRAPENPFPAAYDDVLATYRWAREEATRLGGDPARIGIGGESVGGTMAVATCLTLLRNDEPLPAAQVLVYPLTTAEEFGESMTDAADARPLNLPLLSWMAMHAFAGQPDATKDYRVDLLNTPPDQLALLPPTLVITDERDVLRSQGEEFAARMRAAGGPVATWYGAGVMHEFFGAAAVLDKADEAQRVAAEHFRAAFGRRPALV
jgi:acetyl esterase/lipase